MKESIRVEYATYAYPTTVTRRSVRLHAINTAVPLPIRVTSLNSKRNFNPCNVDVKQTLHEELRRRTDHIAHLLRAQDGM